MGTATTSAIDPEESACARCVSAYAATITTTAAMQIATIPAGGRFFFAVPYSSPMSNSFFGPEVIGGSGGEEGGGGTGVGEDGLDMMPSYSTDCTRGGKSDRPGMFHCPCKLFRRQSVQHVCRSQPCTACLKHSKPDFFQVRGVVRIGIDNNLHPALPGHPQMPIAKVQAVGIGVEFHRHLVPCRSLKNCVHVERISIAAQKNAARGMADD